MGELNTISIGTCSYFSVQILYGYYGNELQIQAHDKDGEVIDKRAISLYHNDLFAGIYNYLLSIGVPIEYEDLNADWELTFHDP